MTIKGFTEHRGTASQMTFDHMTGQFSESPVPHPFLARLEAKVEIESSVVNLARPKLVRSQLANLRAPAQASDVHI
jgi:hypothetical protein